MKSINLHTICLLILLSLNSCDDGVIEDQGQLPLDETIIFEFTYENYAWSPTFNSLMITADGQLHRYEPNVTSRSDLLWNFETADHELTHLAAKENLERAVTVGSPLTESELSQLISASNMIQEDLSNPEAFCADAGINRLWTYTLNDEQTVYQKILVRQCGDQVINNQDLDVPVFIELFNSLFLTEADITCCKR